MYLVSSVADIGISTLEHLYTLESGNADIFCDSMPGEVFESAELVECEKAADAGDASETHKFTTCLSEIQTSATDEFTQKRDDQEEEANHAEGIDADAELPDGKLLVDLTTAPPEGHDASDSGFERLPGPRTLTDAMFLSC